MRLKRLDVPCQFESPWLSRHSEACWDAAVRTVPEKRCWHALDDMMKIASFCGYYTVVWANGFFS